VALITTTPSPTSVNGVKVDVPCKNGFLCVELNGKAGEKIELDLGLTVYCRDTHGRNADKHLFAYMYGALLLGHKTELKETGKEKDWYSDETVSVFEVPEPVSLDPDLDFEQVSRGLFKSSQTDIALNTLNEVRSLTAESSVSQVLFVKSAIGQEF